jgi:hypothetical protein
LAVFGSLYLRRYSTRSEDRLDPSNAKDAKHIRAVILSDDVSGDVSIDDGTESDEDYLKLREGDSESAEDAVLDDDCCNEVDATFYWKGQGQMA